ncbi:MAG: shikimate kinase [Lachnospirales bacterium]
MSKEFCLIGKNIQYSMSPYIHNFLFNEKKIDGLYKICDIDENHFKKFMTQGIYKFKGINVTIPYKKEVLSYLDYIDNTARDIGSVNTIVVKKNSLYGYNTDILGFEKMLKYENIEVKNKKITILGTGATAKMIKFFCEREGGFVTLVSSSIKPFNCIAYDEIESGNILINTTPLGTKGKNFNVSPVSEDVVKLYDTLIDVNYSPFRSKFLSYGIFNNKKVVSGLYMLVAQGLCADKLFFEDNHIDIYYEDVLLTYKEICKDRNIALIGIMGVGKSTFGKLLAQKLDRDFIDFDEYIEKETGKSISTLFEKGEEYFRRLESNHIEALSKRKNLVIATGGGCVLNDKNVSLLYESSKVVWLKRDLNDIFKTLDFENRPLLNVPNPYDVLESLYNERYDLYEKYAEEVIDISDIDTALENFKEL